VRNGRVEIVPLDSVIQWAGNPNDDFTKIKRMQKLLKAHGQVTPITVWTKDNVIYKGNHTHEAMRLNGAGEIRVLFVDFPSHAAAMAYGISDNESGKWSGMNTDVLSALMQSEEVQELGDDNDIKLLTGLTDKGYKGLMLATAGGTPGQLDDIDISGAIDGKADFVVLQFKDRAVLADFRARLGIDKKGRVVDFDNMLKFMQWRPGAQHTDGAPPARRARRERS
jgi:ParB-like nuclease family protein